MVSSGGSLAGEVADIIGSANFHPQAAAFTSLLHMCAKSKHWDKALEVFQGMKKYHPGIVPNTVHFSSLISACGTAGRWREAMEVHLLQANRLWLFWRAWSKVNLPLLYAKSIPRSY